MLVLVVEFRIDAAHAAAFDTEITANARASRETEPGCHQFDVCRDPADPTLFFLYELYADEAAVQSHLQAPHYLRMDATTRPWVRSKVVRRYVRTAG